jgi:hypothetical protein
MKKKHEPSTPETPVKREDPAGGIPDAAQSKGDEKPLPVVVWCRSRQPYEHLKRSTGAEVLLSWGEKVAGLGVLLLPRGKIGSLRRADFGQVEVRPYVHTEVEGLRAMAAKVRAERATRT